MKKFWIVFTRLQSHRDESYEFDAMLRDHRFDSLAAARVEANRKANENGREYFVAEVIGVQVPVYDPKLGWELAE